MIEELAQEKAKIDMMTQEEMGRLWRYAPAGHKYFITGSVLEIYFKERFAELGGMTSAISKQIGWW